MPSKHNRSNGARALFAALADWADNLPTVHQRAEAIQALREVEKYVADVRGWLELAPTSEDTAELRGALHILDDLLERANQSPALATVLGQPVKPKKRPQPPAASSSRTTGESLLRALDNLTVDQIREKLLHDENVSVRDLRAAASVLSARIPSKASRDTIVQHITTRIANQRGYRHLSGGRDAAVDAPT